MKKLAAIAFTLFLGMAAIAQPTVNDPNAQVREAKNFSGINVSSAFEVYLTQGNDEKVAVSSSDPKFMENIKVEVRNNVLYVGWDNKERRRGSGNAKLKAYISFKKINKLAVSGACEVTIVGSINADDLEVDLSGASDIEGKINAKEMKVDMSGSSDMKISGVATNLKLELSGACSFKGFEFATNFLDVHASGASDVKITVNKELSADLSGASDINYKGEGLIRNIKTSGASNVSKAKS